MIETAQQLKALVRNLSKGDSAKAQVIMSSYATERFLERVALSPYRDNLILKGGALIASMVGLANRSTMDIDTTIINMTLSEEAVLSMVEEICAIPLSDNMTFEIKSVRPIMDEADYPGIRVLMEASLDRIRTPMKIDFSTDDVITPKEISYPVKLLFEDRTISLLAYNLETILAEKMQTVIARGVANTRMRDFYDIFTLGGSYADLIDAKVLQDAFHATSIKRGTATDSVTIAKTLERIDGNSDVPRLWNSYGKKFDYTKSITWENVISAVTRMFSLIQDS